MSGYFHWEQYAEEHDGMILPTDVIEEIFLIDVREKKIYLSKKIAENILEEECKEISLLDDDFFEHKFSDKTVHTLKQALQRVMNRKVKRTSCHADIKGKNGELSSVIYFYRLDANDDILGFVSIDYEPMREYEQHLEEVVKQLSHAQKVNELTLEGASDYVYQLDLINNVCTFSSKALDVLPLETPTFSDAMNRVLSFIVPEDRQIFLGSFTPFLTGQSDRHIAEYRVNTKQGDIMWISCNGKGIHDEQGRPMMIAGTLVDVTERKKEQEKIQNMLYYDSLTKLKNRSCFEKDLKETLENKHAKGSVLYMNIRKFKLYNELFGHSFGNKVLQEFAYMLNLYFADSYGIYRFSGDEFLIHIRECNREKIMQKLLPFQSTLKQPRELEGHKLYINACVAVVIYPEHGKTVEDILNCAHQCLYRMTREEKDDISFFAGAPGDAISKMFLLENELRKDIELNYRHFRIVYQPIVRVEENEVRWIGAEALLRYNNPEFDDLGQMDLIRTLEYSGLIVPVGRWIIREAVRECSKWNRRGGDYIVHVNIAAQQVSDSGLVQYIKDVCDEEGVDKKNLVVEITETSLLNNIEVATNFCNELLSCDVGVSLDDFGTGYSSFNYLRTLPITEVKIDKEHTRQLEVNQYNQTFINFIRQLTNDLHVGLCVEGVETQSELDLLQKMGIDTIQGFYFERPMESDMICREFLGRTTK